VKITKGVKAAAQTGIKIARRKVRCREKLVKGGMYVQLPAGQKYIKMNKVVVGLT